jgi:hypothetical protein
MGTLIVAIVIMCLTSLFFLFVFGFFAYLRYLKHKELMAFAEKGLLPPQHDAAKAAESSGTLRQAIILIAVGAALSIGLYPLGWIAMPGQLPLNLGPWMAAGFIPLFFGLGMLLIYFLPHIQSLVDHRLEKTANAPSEQPANGQSMNRQAADEPVDEPVGEAQPVAEGGMAASMGGPAGEGGNLEGEREPR